MKTHTKHLVSLCFAAFTAAANAAPVTYQIDESHTYPRFSYSHLGLSTQLSSFSKTSGKVIYDSKAKTGSVEINIDMKSVNTGFTDFNEHIQAEDFFHTAKYPTATFTSDRVIFEGDKPKSIEGKLTIKGVTRPVALTVTSFMAIDHPMKKKPALGANAYTQIKRSEFNSGKFAPYVSDEVRIDIAIEALAP